MPQPKSLDEWRSEGAIQSQNSCLLVRSQGSIQHRQSKTESWHQGGQGRYIRSDWRETSTPTTPKICGRRTSEATKAGVPPSCVRPCCQMSLTPFMLALISSTKNKESAVKSIPPPDDWPLSISTGCKTNPDESEYE